MRIDIWSDVVCPWCYIGKRRLEKAIAGRDDVEVVYHSFELDPSSPREARQTVAEHLGQKYGGGAAAGQAMIDQVEAVAAEEGLIFRLGEAKRGNTVDAHRLLHLSLDEGGRDLQGRFKEALLAAYFLRAENPADHAMLAAVADETGLDPARTRAVLASDEYADAVEADVRQAVAYGATGVPFFVIDGRYGISGAQPVEVFAQVLAQADAERAPLVRVGGATDDACGPDGCAI
ncbi:MAG: DsbA family oxidoreductase [Nocardioides sp.]